MCQMEKDAFSHYKGIALIESSEKKHHHKLTKNTPSNSNKSPIAFSAVDFHRLWAGLSVGEGRVTLVACVWDSVYGSLTPSSGRRLMLE